MVICVISASAAQEDFMVKYYYISKNYLYVMPNSVTHGQ